MTVATSLPQAVIAAPVEAAATVAGPEAVQKPVQGIITAATMDVAAVAAAMAAVAPSQLSPRSVVHQSGKCTGGAFPTEVCSYVAMRTKGIGHQLRVHYRGFPAKYNEWRAAKDLRVWDAQGVNDFIQARQDRL